MRKREILLVTIAASFLVIFLFGKSVVPARGQARTEPSFAAIPSEKGGQDVFAHQLGMTIGVGVAGGKALRDGHRSRVAIHRGAAGEHQGGRAGRSERSACPC